MRPGRRRTGEVALSRRAAFRLGVQAATLVGLVVVALTAVSVLVIIRAQHQQDAVLLDDAIAHADDVEDPPSATYLIIRGADGRVAETPGTPVGATDPGALDAAAAGREPAAAERDVGGVEYEVVTGRRSDGVTVQAVLDLTANHAARDGLLRAMLVTGVVGLLLAAAVGVWLGRRALTPLSAALSLQRRFVADAGHELRTPLTLLGTRAQLLRRRLRREPGMPTDALDEVDGVVADSGRLAAIVDDLLLAADPFSEQPREEVDLAVLCRDAVDAAAADAHDRSVDVSVDVRTPLPVSGAPPALLRALTALVDNAVRHAASAVVVSGRSGEPRPDTVLVEVRDDGDGVDPQMVPHLFDRFRSGDPGTAPDHPGRRRHGLGLALIAEIAAQHGGHVELAPLPAGGPATGAVFRLVLPSHRAVGVVPRNL